MPSSGSSVAVQDEPCLSFTARSSSVSRPHIWRQYVAALSGSWCVCVMRRLKYVCFSCRAGPPRTVRRVSHSRAGVREAQTLRGSLWKKPAWAGRALLLLGRPGGRRLSQLLLVWAGPLREPVEPCGPPPQGDLREGCVFTIGPAQRGGTSLGERLWARGLPQALCPMTARCRIRGTRWGWSI